MSGTDRKHSTSGPVRAPFRSAAYRTSVAVARIRASFVRGASHTYDIKDSQFSIELFITTGISEGIVFRRKISSVCLLHFFMTSDRKISRGVISFHCKQPLSNKNEKFATDDDSSLVKRRYRGICRG